MSSQEEHGIRLERRGAVAWVVLRLVYGVCYIKDLATLRSLVWRYRWSPKECRWSALLA